MIDKDSITLGEIDMIIFNVGLIANNCSDEILASDYFVRDELKKRNSRVEEYKEFLLESYSDENLYVIIRELKDFYYDDSISLPVNRIIESLSKSLYDRLPLVKKEDYSSKVDYFSSKFYEIVDGNKSDDALLDSAFTFVDFISVSCDVAEKRAFVKNVKMPDNKIAKSIISSINMDIYSDTFKDYFSSKSIDGKVKK